MGDITIRFRMNVATGKKDIVVEYEGDEDALPHEHERRHREIVEKLVGHGLVAAEAAGEVVVERVKPPPARARETPPGEAAAEKASG